MVVQVAQEHRRPVLLLRLRARLLLLLGPTLLIQRQENEWWLGEVSVSWRFEYIGGTGPKQDNTYGYRLLRFVPRAWEDSGT